MTSAGDLNNNGGKLAGAGPVLIKGVTDLSNQNGQLASQKTLNLLTGSLDNSNKGTIAANDRCKSPPAARCATTLTV